MTNEERIKYEQYFNGKGLLNAEIDFHIQLMRLTKEIAHPKYNISGEIFDLVYMKLTNNVSYIGFEGALSNNFENRYLSGTINKTKDGYHIITDVYRFFAEENKEYRAYDTFTIREKGIRQDTYYNDSQEMFSRQVVFDLSDYQDFQKRKIK
jgi:hypothetical protein